MVLSDPFRPNDSNTPQEFRSPLIIDRLAAFAIDWFCFSFIAFIALAPLKRNLIVARLLEREDDFFFGYSLSLLVIFGLALFYNTFFLTWKGATPGKLALRLKVVNVWKGDPLTFTTALMRSFGWCVSCVLLFLPHLAIFFNERRRPFYDRIADTELISLSGRFASRPSGPARQMAKVTLAALATLVFALVVEDLYHYVRVSSELQKWKDELVGVSPNSCASVEELQEEWRPIASRLTIALALYSANNLEEDCLSVEAFKAFQSGDEVELAYLAKSFIHSDDAELSDAYLKRVCQENSKSEACEFSQMIELWADEDLAIAGEKFESLLKSSSVFIKIWAVKHYERTKDFAKELAVIDMLWETKGLGTFVDTHRGVAYWGLHRRDEARVALTSAIHKMTGSQRMEVSSWFCYRELADNCDAVKTPACRAFVSSADELSESFSSSGHLLTFLKVKECEAPAVNFEELASRAPNEQGLRFLKAIADLRANKKEEALQVLRPILFDDEWDRAYKDEALRRLVTVFDTESDLNEVTELWSEGDPTSWEWRTQGVSLLREVIKRKYKDLALAVGEKLDQQKGLPEYDKKALLVFAFKSGSHQFAFNLLHTKSRLPASESQENMNDDYDDVVRSLLREFEK